MHSLAAVVTVVTFALTMIFIFWRPKGVNEAIPATCGALLVMFSGAVTWRDLFNIAETVGGAATTIISTIVMAIVLESFGFFVYAAELLERRVKNSGIRLFWYVNLLCFLMTLFFNNDGSILITTPILLILLKQLGLKPHQQIPYLLSGALIATASSAPIGVSNIVNLISLKIVGMSLYTFSAMMFVPAITGLGVLLLMMYVVMRKHLTVQLSGGRDLPPPRAAERDIQLRGIWPLRSNPAPMRPTAARSYLWPPTTFSIIPPIPAHHPSSGASRAKFMRSIFIYVFGVRVSLFAASYFGIPVPLAAVCGAMGLLLWRWFKLKTSPHDIVLKTPWHILIFAFSMYVVIFGLHKIGLTAWLVQTLQPVVSENWLHAVVVMGLVVTAMSSLFNNHPALMIGTLTLTGMLLDPMTVKIAYLGNVVGSDIGSLILPIGTLATLIWMHILKQHRVYISWRRYIGVTAFVIPVAVVVTLLLLYIWVSLIF